MSKETITIFWVLAKVQDKDEIKKAYRKMAIEIPPR